MKHESGIRSRGRIKSLIPYSLFLLLVVGIPLADAALTSGEIYSGVRVGNVALGGQSYAQARATFKKAFDSYLAQDISFTLQDQKISAPIGHLIFLDSEATLQQAQAVGHEGSLWTQLIDRVELRLKGRILGTVLPKDIAIEYREMLGETLRRGFSGLEQLPQEAHFIFTFPQGKPQAEASEGVTGSTINFKAAEVELYEKRVVSLSDAPIPLELVATEPTLHAADLEPLRAEAEKLLARPPKEVIINTTHFTITPQILASWITATPVGSAFVADRGTLSVPDSHAQRDGRAPPRSGQANPTLQLDQTKIAAWLDTVAKGVEQKPVDAVFELSEDGKRADKFNIGTPGIALPRKENAARIAEAMLGDKPVELITQEVKPNITSAVGLTEYAISELVGRGVTNFKGSPINRIKNIKRGAALLNGLLIAPDEEFSVLDHLRPFTEENGYLKELVIKAKEGKTAPEIGGGLCQIGTTTFRTVLNAGLPVTARANHSYRVSYYEPPVGMDATIYDPAPDFKFVNDTGQWLLLMTHIKGTELTFELWGTKDGRLAQSSAPEISNIQKPPEKKIVETLDLPPGKTKCTEHAHIGSDAKFTYTVTYADGRVETKEFKSHYRPWQEVCLLGVKELTPVPEEVPSAEAPDTGSATLPSADGLGAVGDTAPPAPAN